MHLTTHLIWTSDIIVKTDVIMFYLGLLHGAFSNYVQTFFSISGVSRVGLKVFFSKSHTSKGLVKVSASKGVMRVDLKKNHGRGGGFPDKQKTPRIRH